MLIHTLLTNDNKNKGAAMSRSAACTPYRSNHILQELREEFLLALGPRMQLLLKTMRTRKGPSAQLHTCPKLILQILLPQSQVPSYWVLCPLGYQLGSCWNGNVSKIALELPTRLVDNLQT